MDRRTGGWFRAAHMTSDRDFSNDAMPV